jgi:hypothetical protein
VPLYSVRPRVQPLGLEGREGYLQMISRADKLSTVYESSKHIYLGRPSRAVSFEDWRIHSPGTAPGTLPRSVSHCREGRVTGVIDWASHHTRPRTAGQGKASLSRELPLQYEDSPRFYTISAAAEAEPISFTNNTVLTRIQTYIYKGVEGK